jgi:hypothetical protein
MANSIGQAFSEIGPKNLVERRFDRVLYPRGSKHALHSLQELVIKFN